MRYYIPDSSISSKGFDIKQTFDGGYIVVCDKESTKSSGRDLYLLKVNYLGIPEWSKTFLGHSNSYNPNTIIQAKDSCFVLTYNGMSVIKCNQRGNLIWQKSFSGTSKAIILAKDNNYIIYGEVSDSISYQNYILKVDTSGNIIWNKRFGYEVLAQSVVESIDSCIYTISSLYTIHYQNISKLSKNGDLIWSKNILPNTYSDKKVIIEKSFNELYIGYGLSERYHLLKIDTSGAVLWDSSFAFLQNYNMLGFDVMCKTTNGDFILGGAAALIDTIGYDFAFIKINQNGNLIYRRAISTAPGSQQEILGIDYTNDNGLVLVGETSYGNVGQRRNIIIAKTDSNGYTSPIILIKNHNQFTNNFELYQNYPNPFNPVTNIKYQIANSSFVSLKIYDVLGREVSTLVNEFKKAGSYIVTFNGSALASGVYFYRLNAGDFSETKRMLIIK